MKVNKICLHVFVFMYLCCFFSNWCNQSKQGIYAHKIPDNRSTAFHSFSQDVCLVYLLIIYFETMYVLTFKVLVFDFQIVFLQCDRYIEFHARYGRYHRLRIPKFGRDMAYHEPSCDLYVVGSRLVLICGLINLFDLLAELFFDFSFFFLHLFESKHCSKQNILGFSTQMAYTFITVWSS